MVQTFLMKPNTTKQRKRVRLHFRSWIFQRYSAFTYITQLSTFILSRSLVLATDFSKVCRDDSHFAVKKCCQQATKHPFTVNTKKGNILWPTHHTCVWVRTTPHLWLTWGANFLFFTPAGIGWLSSTQIHQPYWFPLKWGKWRNLTRTLHTLPNS